MDRGGPQSSGWTRSSGGATRQQARAMVHSLKFAFSLPGRRHNKQQQHHVTPISGPLNKAQKILGFGELNIDSHSIREGATNSLSGWEAFGEWDAQLTDAISICDSETTTSRHTGPGSGADGASGPRTMDRWETESSILPRDQGTLEKESATETWSLGHRLSCSTIRSYYDKTKLPLSISQQTSASAMAKGLPAKAHALLAIGDEAPGPQLSTSRKKPLRLDLSLSHLCPRLNRSRPDKATLAKGLVLGRDLMTRSPSVLSGSPGRTSPGNPGEMTRRLIVGCSGNRDAPSASHAARYWNLGPRPPRPLTGLDLSGMLSPPEMRSKSSSKLHSLYQHYEQLTSRDAMDEKNAKRMEKVDAMAQFRATGPPTAPARPSGAEYRTRHGTELLSSLRSGSDSGLSISSRHTRTSRASKRTERSMQEADLRKDSVLCLSSDSEDDELDASRPTTMLSAAGSLESRGSSADEASLASARPSAMPGLEEAQYQICGPSSALPQHHVGLRRENRASPVSSPPTTDSAPVPVVSSLSGQLTSQARQTLPGSTESQIISMFPASPRLVNPMEKKESDAPSCTPDQLTPPLSPSSVDFFLQSRPGSVATTEAGSIRSNHSRRGRAGSSGHSQELPAGRMIVVTRQEEMLLAALRIKRARMRNAGSLDQAEEKQEKPEDVLQRLRDERAHMMGIVGVLRQGQHQQQRHSQAREVRRVGTNDASGSNPLPDESAPARLAILLRSRFALPGRPASCAGQGLSAVALPQPPTNNSYPRRLCRQRRRDLQDGPLQLSPRPAPYGRESSSSMPPPPHARVPDDMLILEEAYLGDPVDENDDDNDGDHEELPCSNSPISPPMVTSLSMSPPTHDSGFGQRAQKRTGPRLSAVGVPGAMAPKAGGQLCQQQQHTNAMATSPLSPSYRLFPAQTTLRLKAHVEISDDHMHESGQEMGW